MLKVNELSDILECEGVCMVRVFRRYQKWFPFGREGVLIDLEYWLLRAHNLKRRVQEMNSGDFELGTFYRRSACLDSVQRYTNYSI